MRARRTSPPTGGRAIVLYDGRCVFCTRQAARLGRHAVPGWVNLVDSGQSGSLAEFPGLMPEDVDRALHVVLPDGSVYSGAEAIVRVLASRRCWRPLVWLYRVPGVRWATEGAYAWIGRHRYLLGGRTVSAACDSGACERPD